MLRWKTRGQIALGWTILALGYSMSFAAPPVANDKPLASAAQPLETGSTEIVEPAPLEAAGCPPTAGCSCCVPCPINSDCCKPCPGHGALARAYRWKSYRAKWNPYFLKPYGKCRTHCP